MARAPAVQEIEAAPEADRLEGFPHPRETARLFGHEAAAHAFAQAVGEGRIHHAWLLAGREGIGKATLAYACARYALATPEERSKATAEAGTLAVPPGSIADRQVRALSHPGLLVIRRPWDHKAKRLLTQITVEEVRRLRSFLAHSAGTAAWRVVIVDAADELNISAANALLKSLEEPPPRTLFLLVSSEPGRLLTTIRSRCRRLELAALEPDALRAAAMAAFAAADRKPPTDAEWPRLIAASRGSVRRLLVLAEAEGARLGDKTLKLVSSLPRLEWLQVHGLADELTGPGTEQRFEQFWELLMDLIAGLVRTRAIAVDGGAQVGAEAADLAPLAARVIPDGALATWAELWETLGAAKAEAMAINLDRKALILESFARLQAAARA